MNIVLLLLVEIATATIVAVTLWRLAKTRTALLVALPVALISIALLTYAADVAVARFRAEELAGIYGAPVEQMYGGSLPWQADVPNFFRRKLRRGQSRGSVYRFVKGYSAHEVGGWRMEKWDIYTFKLGILSRQQVEILYDRDDRLTRVQEGGI